ncbi:MAG: class I SAM-dependent methyltransferase [Opitutaceae bacterium]|jgi:ubiquinone/menaquinone biosynthesis C-methylase UbiE|nr:class I SAM-dependent methyltransferase [Opitutaceae bacterium]
MDTAEYENLARVEKEHWYYVGKREFVRRWIQRIRPPTATERLLDCGAGTGIFAEEMNELCDVTVMDTFEESLALLRQRFPADRVITLEDGEVPLGDHSIEYVTALDVLEHVPDDRGVVKGFARMLKPGGLAAVTVPASMSLWSDWDVGLQHYRRYDRPQLINLFDEQDWELVHANYTNVPVFPLVWLIRRLQRGNKKSETSARAEDKVPSSLLNRLLKWQFVRFAMSWLPMPFGVSLVLIARRR